MGDTTNTLPAQLVNQITSARLTNTLDSRSGISLDRANAMFILAFRAVRAGDTPTFEQLLANTGPIEPHGPHPSP